jgi:hypothetical protein
MRMGLPMPKLWLIPEDSPNAFATGRNPNHASVAVTAGALGLMNDQELEGVLAHELGHVKNRDILTSSIAAVLASAITFLARMAFGFGLGNRDEREEGGGFGGLDADRRANRGAADPDGYLANTRIRSRPDIGRGNAQSAGTDRGVEQARYMVETHPDA